MTEIEELYHRLSYFESIGIMDLKKGQEMEFACPECGAKAHAVRIASTGLLGVWCDVCGGFVAESQEGTMRGNGEKHHCR